MIDGFVIVGHHLEVVGQRNFVVSVQIVYDGELYAQALQCVGIKSHLLKIGHTQQLSCREARVNQRTEQVEHCAYLQRLAHRSHGLHGRVEKRSVQIRHVALLDRVSKMAFIVGELNAVLLHHIACPAYRSSSVVTVLGYVISGTCHYETGTRRYVERILAVASGTYYIYRSKFLKVYRHTGFKQCFSKAGKLVYLYASHLKYGEQ